MQKSWERFGAALLAAALLLVQGVPLLFWSAGRAIPADGGGPSITDAPSDVGKGAGTKLIALTFDDGPSRASTTRLLDGLAQRGAQATFFLMGKNVEVNHDLVRRMEDDGHQVGVHSYDHRRNLLGLNRAGFAAQVDRTRNLLADILGHNDFIFRPPYGFIDEGAKKWVGAPIILWSIDPEDWGDQNADREVAHIVEKARDGDIILMHDIFDPTVDAALRVIDLLHEQGFYFVTIKELFDQKHIPLVEGEVYRNAYS